jgi:anti-sigma factor RsiW
MMHCGQVRTHLGDHLEGDLELSTRAQVDEHLEACTDCASELQELRSTVALVRSLPEPTVPAGLADTVMRRIDDGEGRRQHFSFLARRGISPRLALPLAAGIAGVLFFVGTNDIFFAQEVRVAAVPSAEVVADPIAVKKWEAVPPTLSRNRGLQSRLVAAEAPTTKRDQMMRLRFAAMNHSIRNRLNRSDHRDLVIGFFGRTDPDSAQLDLDRELERAKADPEAFLSRFNEVTEMDRRSTIAPLVVLANRRGEARMVADRLRSTLHPLAVSLASQFERERTPPTQRRRPTSTSFEY